MLQKINKFILTYLTSFKVLVWLLCLTPLAFLIFKGFQEDLSANPVEFVTRFTGKYALIFLCITLSITPIRKIFKLNSLIRFRRLVGLFSFFYALLHFTIWFWLDHNLDFTEMFQDVIKRPFITVGFIALLLLMALTLTSFNKAIKYLGKTWQKLHYLIYVVAILVIAHYYWIKSSKNNFSNVYIYGAIVLILLMYRLVKKLKNR